MELPLTQRVVCAPSRNQARAAVLNAFGVNAFPPSIRLSRWPPALRPGEHARLLSAAFQPVFPPHNENVFPFSIPVRSRLCYAPRRRRKNYLPWSARPMTSASPQSDPGTPPGSTRFSDRSCVTRTPAAMSTTRPELHEGAHESPARFTRPTSLGAANFVPAAPGIIAYDRPRPHPFTQRRQDQLIST